MATNTKDEASGGVIAEAQQKGTEIMETTGEQVVAKASEVRDEAAFQLREQVDQRSTEAGEQVEAVAQALRSGVEQLRTEGKSSPANLVDTLAGRAQDLGGYLKSADADRILDDVEDFARRRPWLAAGGAALAGFVASRFVKASSDRRYQTRRVGNRSLVTQSGGVPAGARQ